MVRRRFSRVLVLLTAVVAIVAGTAGCDKRCELCPTSPTTPTPNTPTTYTLTVNSGSGSGSYTAGTVVNVAANAPPTGQMFDRWTGDTSSVANVNSPNTTVTMPASNVTITATHKDVPPTCTYTIPTTTGTIPAAGGNTGISVVTNLSTCPWTPTTATPWITIVSGTGPGSGTVLITVAPNTGAARTGVVTIAGQNVSVPQEAAPPTCTYTLSLT